MTETYFLSLDDRAFLDAYRQNVASAPREIVEVFLSMQDDHDGFYEMYSEYYSSIADAHGVWQDALKHARKGQPA